MRTSKFNILYIIGFCLMACLFQSICWLRTAKLLPLSLTPDTGGMTRGAIGRKGREKNINLNVALKLGRMIQDNCSDTRVVYTRKNDVFVPLHRRAENSQQHQSRLVYFHPYQLRASRKSQVFGAETYTLGFTPYRRKSGSSQERKLGDPD